MLSQNQIQLITNSFSQLTTNTNFVEISSVNFSISANNNFNYKGKSIKALTNLYSGKRALLFQDTNTKQYYAVGEEFNPTLSERSFTRKAEETTSQRLYFLAPKYFYRGVYFVKGGTTKFAPSTSYGQYNAPKKYNAKHYIQGEKIDLGSYGFSALWWESAGFAGFYLDGVYIYTSFDNEGFAEIGEVDGFAPWSGESGTRWGIPAVFSKDGVNWNTPAREGAYYETLLGSLTEQEFYNVSTSLFSNTGIECTWSSDYSTIYLKGSDCIDLYLYRDNDKNLKNYDSLGSFYWFSRDRGKTWRAGITKENFFFSSYNFGTSPPAYKEDCVYYGILDRPSQGRLFRRRVISGVSLVGGATSLVLPFAISQEMVGYRFSVDENAYLYNDIYTISSISEDGLTINFNPPLITSGGSLIFNLILSERDVKYLNTPSQSVVVKQDLTTEITSSVYNWPTPSKLDTFYKDTYERYTFAIDYIPLEDNSLQEFHSASDSHFAPLTLSAQVYQWPGQNRIIGLLFGNDWLCPYKKDSTERITSADLSEFPSWEPFNHTYTNFYRQINTSEKYRLIAADNESSIYDTTKSLIGTWELGVGPNFDFPENILVGSLSQVGDYWITNHSVNNSCPSNTIFGTGNSVCFILKVRKDSRDILYITTNGQTYEVVPQSELLTGETILGYNHTGSVSDTYGYLWYEANNDTINILYGASDSSGQSYIYHVSTTDGLVWNTAQKEKIRSFNEVKRMVPILGDRLPNKITTRSLATNISITNP